MKIKQVLNSVNTKHIRGQLRDFYHRKGPGRKPLNPMAMLKAQLLKHLLRIPIDRGLALLLKHDRRKARACGFKKQTPSHELFTHFTMVTRTGPLPNTRFTTAKTRSTGSLTG